MTMPLPKLPVKGALVGFSPEVWNDREALENIIKALVMVKGVLTVMPGLEEDNPAYAGGQRG